MMNIQNPEFYHPDGNLVLTVKHDANQVFCIHKAVLACITPTFHTMFNLPTSNNLFYDGAPIVQMHNDPECLRCLIQLMCGLR